MVQASAIAKKRSSRPSSQKPGRPTKLEGLSKAACTYLTPNVRSLKAKAAIRAAFANAPSAESVAGHIELGITLLLQHLGEGKITAEAFHRRYAEYVDIGRKLVEARARAVAVYDAPATVTINIGPPPPPDGPGDILEIG